MSPRGVNPEDYEYGGNNPPVYSVESEPVARTSRLRATTVGTTALLVVAGLAGGAAFALSSPGQSGTSTTAPVVQSESASVQTAENVAATPEASASSTAAGPTPATSSSSSLGKTIAVPPAAFDDKNGEREFHENPSTSGSSSGTVSGSAPAAGSGQSSSGTTSGTPSFGGGEDHHKKHLANTADIRFNSGSDDNGTDD